MREDFWTLSIIPHCGKSPKTYTLCRWHIYVLIASSALMVMVLTLLIYGQLKSYSGEWKIEAVLAENQALLSRLGEMETKIAEFEERMEGITTAEERFREIAGLYGIEPEVREVGIGGPSVSSHEREGLAWLEESTGDKIENTDERLSKLFRRVDLVYQSLVESIDQMEYNHDKFSRTPSIWPTRGRISSRYGARAHPIFGGVRPHEGIDIDAPKGTPIMAAAGGRVIRAGWKVGYGLTLLIDHDYGYRTFYAHCSKLKVKRGDLVERGEIIALVGNTGVTTGPHLHYEVMIDGVSKNPSNYILGDAVPD